MKILLIDNYDSFTYNLYHYISNFKKNVEVVRNDKIDGKRILRKKYRGYRLHFDYYSKKFRVQGYCREMFAWQ